MLRSVYPFALATMTPAVMLGIGGVLGSTFWLLLALIYMTVFTFALDLLGGKGRGVGVDVGGYDTLSVTLALLHFGLLGLAVATVAQGNGFQSVIAFFAFGLFFGQVSNSNAHELIHRPTRQLHWLGAWVFISHLFGHHTSAHRLVHHRYVATDADPNSAPMGRSFYAFLIKAWRGSFWGGLAEENQCGAGVNPYLTYIVGAAVFVAISWWIAGFSGVLAYGLLAVYASTQILLSDYVQHYGLRRRVLDGGKPEPVTDQHTWDSPHRFSGLLMLNAPRHSDHHAHPSRPYPALTLPNGGPVLPYSLPVMGFIAWFPGAWRRLMDPRVGALNKLRDEAEKVGL